MSYRSTFFAALDSIIGSVSGVTTHQHGPNWPVLSEYSRSNLDFCFIKHNEVNIDTADIGNDMQIETIEMRYYYLDYNSPAQQSTFETKVENLVEGIKAKLTANNTVNILLVKQVTSLETEFPIVGFEVICEAEYITSDDSI